MKRSYKGSKSGGSTVGQKQKCTKRRRVTSSEAVVVAEAVEADVVGAAAVVEVRQQAI